MLWAQSRGYSVCGFEVQLPRCRFRADLAAYRPNGGGKKGSAAIFECKQAFPDLRRDNGCSAVSAKRLERVFQRRQEKNFSIIIPPCAVPDSLFSDFDSHNFAAIEHRGYAPSPARVERVAKSPFRLAGKFERLIRYRCANLFFLVVSNRLFREPEFIGWGTLVRRF